MFIKVRFFIFCSTLISVLLFSASAHAEKQHITFSTFASPHDSVLGKISELTFTEAFRRLNMTFSIVVLPLKRAAIEINEGHIDGDLGRSFNYSDHFPNIIRMKESFLSAKLVAFAKKKNIKVSSTKDLKNTQLKVSYPLGSSIIESLLTNIVPAKNLTTINNRTSALKMLTMGRNDIYIDGELDILKLLQETEFKDSGIYSAGTITVIPVYTILHKKHKNLIPKLMHILHEMKSQGLINQYTKIALQKNPS